jgi:hypothetical protein
MLAKIQQNNNRGNNRDNIEHRDRSATQTPAKIQLIREQRRQKEIADKVIKATWLA